MTNEFTTRRLVRCPASQAAHRLADYFADHGTADVGRIRLTLRAGSGEGGLAKDVLASFTRITTADARFPEYEVRWSPDGGGPYPSYAGRLAVDPDDDYDTFMLRLKGGYDAPFGVAGKIFDAAAGRKIAKATIVALLGTIAEDVERRFQDDERKKPGYQNADAGVS